MQSSIKAISLFPKNNILFSILIHRSDNSGLKINNTLFPSLELKFKSIFFNIGIDLKISDLNIDIAPEEKFGSVFLNNNEILDVYHLPIFLSILKFFKIIDFNFENYLCIGNILDNGSIVPTKGTFVFSLYARGNNFSGIICPRNQSYEASLFCNDIQVIGFKHILELINYLNHGHALFINNKQLNFNFNLGLTIKSDNNLVLIGNLDNIYRFMHRINLIPKNSQVIEMASYIGCRKILDINQVIIRPVIDFQFCLDHFISNNFCFNSSFECKNLILNHSLFEDIYFDQDIFDLITNFDFPVIFVHNFTCFPFEDIKLLIDYFNDEKFSRPKLIFSTENISSAQSLEGFNFINFDL